MYARVCDATGWTWDYVGQCLTLPRLRALMRRWAKVPPVSESVAAFVYGDSPGDAVASSGHAANEPTITNEDVVREMHSDPRKVQWVGIQNG